MDTRSRERSVNSRGDPEDLEMCPLLKTTSKMVVSDHPAGLSDPETGRLGGTLSSGLDLTTFCSQTPAGDQGSRV